MRDNIDEIPSGGIGIKIIGKIADELSYTRTSDGRNCLFIVKSYQQPGLVPSQQSIQDGFFKRAIDVLTSFDFGLPKQRVPQPDPISNQLVQKICLQINTDIKAVARVLSWAEQLDPLPIPLVVVHQCKLAVIEGFTNAVRHAHKNLPLETPIELEIMVFKEHLEVKIWDWGEPFDIQAKLKEEFSQKSLY
ncbi:putative anti-sigma regulatory factor, serine/threonine protein kinase [Oscillatoria nigro-viridis PCC 7112]|uniref:Putative anti-sigma regulatory factor, serine/threonine protein kinase n=1 Tax=Phormidium nigroviride PCC 7112 TaxID=179408 RepID=K9VG48_9CYAN|nr:ATP-binding protein [Oscillatoria nigro-viridis]AFZ06494.1 putative anti-sigma regulatory factor, serine/threonine protein kinase [Oscillatoria nigro-viridis PCC 7112]